MAALTVANLQESYGTQEVVAGVSFAIARGFQTVAAFLLLTHAVELARPLLLGEIPKRIVLHLGVLLACDAAAFYAATVLFRRRLLK
jgi:lipooligosaccharide transport system permease protein